MCVLSAVNLGAVYAQWSGSGVCVLSSVCLCGVSTLWIVCTEDGVFLCEVSALCSVCGQCYVCVWCLHSELCFW